MIIKNKFFLFNFTMIMILIKINKNKIKKIDKKLIQIKYKKINYNKTYTKLREIYLYLN